MSARKKIVLYLLFIVLIVIFVFQVINFNESQFFMGQLNLTETGIKLFSVTKDDTGQVVFTTCKRNDSSCRKEIKVSFQLDNGDKINQLSLENLIARDIDGRDVQLELVSDAAQSVKLAKSGEADVKGLSSGDFPIDPKDAVYVKGVSGITFKVPEEGKGFDFFNLGYWINESTDVKIVTYERETADKTGQVFVAVPAFLTDRIGGGEIADFILKMADDINVKIAKTLGVDKISYYLVLTPAVLAPDFYRSTYYTASGMAYVKIFDPDTNQELIPKYGINFEKGFPKCTKPGDYSKVRCFEDKDTQGKLQYLLSHELSHIYQYKKGNLGEKTIGSREAFWEAGAELNALSLYAGDAFKTQIKARSAATQKCNALNDEHKIGLCIVVNFLDDIDVAKIKKFFFVDKSYDFGKDTGAAKYCDAWFGLMQEIIGNDLQSQRQNFDSNVCVAKKIKR
jgi:hypothetical protein